MVYSIDRLEGDWAVLVDQQGNTSTVPRQLLPAEAKEGDMLRLEDGHYHVDEALTRQRRQQIRALQQKLKNKFK